MPAQLNITVTITFYFGSGRFKRGEPGGPVPPLPHPLWIFFFTKAKFMSKKLILDENEIYYKMLEMAISETQIFINFGGDMPPDPLRKLAPLALVVPPPHPFESPGSAPVSHCCNYRFKWTCLPFTFIEGFSVWYQSTGIQKTESPCSSLMLVSKIKSS